MPCAGTLSSYAYHLLLIFYLQTVPKPPVLPCLQELDPPSDFAPFMVNEFNTYYQTDLNRVFQKVAICIFYHLFGYTLIMLFAGIRAAHS